MNTQSIKQLPFQLTLNEIRAITQASKDEVLKDVYEVDLSYAKGMLNEIAQRSFTLWEKKNGEAQVKNTFISNLTGHIAELAVRDYYVEQGFRNVEAPDLMAYAQNIHETSPYDIVADGIPVQVKGISNVMDPKFQVTGKNTIKYQSDGTQQIVFVYVDHITFKANIYGITTPQAMIDANDIEENLNRDPTKRRCYSARSVATKPWLN